MSFRQTGVMLSNAPRYGHGVVQGRLTENRESIPQVFFTGFQMATGSEIALPQGRTQRATEARARVMCSCDSLEKEDVGDRWEADFS